MEPLNWLIDYLVREWQVIKGAPVIFLTTAAVIVGVAWWILEWGYAREIASLEREISACEKMTELKALSTKVSPADIAKMIENLSVVEKVARLKDGNIIELQHQPIPQSIELIVNGLSYDIREQNGLRLTGKEIFIKDIPEGIPMLVIVRESMPSGGVVIKYIRQE